MQHIYFQYPPPQCACLLNFFLLSLQCTPSSVAWTNFLSTTSRLMYGIATRLLSMRWYVEFAELLQLQPLESWPSYKKKCRRRAIEGERKRTTRKHSGWIREKKSGKKSRSKLKREWKLRLMLPWDEIKEEKLRFSSAEKWEKSISFHSAHTWLSMNSVCMYFLNLSI